MSDRDDAEVERHQEAYHKLSDLLDVADELLNSGVHNEQKLKEAFSKGENLLFELDQIEYELIRQIDRAEQGGPDAE